MCIEQTDKKCAGIGIAMHIGKRLNACDEICATEGPKHRCSIRGAGIDSQQVHTKMGESGKARVYKNVFKF
jgi:hypothetical protein